MGLTRRSAREGERASSRLTYACALAGNPNVGKSSLFNALTGLDQHTGNWTGKTVELAVGNAVREDITFVDLPGTYSLRAHSPEEEVAREFILRGDTDVTVVVLDATNVERGLPLALQIIELTARVVVCVNLADEAKRRGITVNINKLSELLGVPVVKTSARGGEGLTELCKAVREIAKNPPEVAPVPLKYPPELEAEIARLTSGGRTRGEVIDGWLCEANEERERVLLARPVILAEAIACEVVTGRCGYSRCEYKIDRVLTHPVLSIPIMLLLLAAIFYLTIVGSNYPSALLGELFDSLEAWIYSHTGFLPSAMRDALVLGVLRTLFRVISVMLPPMAIFFPLFTLAEDLGLLGRIAFNLDGAFMRAKTCGKQALTMCMGLGCNSVGVIGCRIIDSPRERLIAVLTNNFMPCNGRFPILIAMSALLGASTLGGITGAVVMLGAVVLSVLVTLAVSRLLSATLLRGKVSSFTLELPSYRVPKIGSVIVRSVFDRTLFVLGRAAAVAAPAGLIIWLFANVHVGSASLLSHAASALDGIGTLVGLDGTVLCAFILGFPANEIVLPLVVMGYSQTGVLGTDAGIAAILAANGWGALQYINMIILTLFHFPCSTTVLTIKKETGSVLYTALAVVLPTAIGMLICMLTTLIAAFFA